MKNLHLVARFCRVFGPLPALAADKAYPFAYTGFRTCDAHGLKGGIRRMRKTGSALAGLATLSLALAGCGSIEPVHHLPPQVAPGGCHEITTFGARLPLPVSSLEQPMVPGAEETAWQTDPRSDPVGLKILDALSQTPPIEESVVPGQAPVSESVLILSGGSQQGAFGAGFMSAWEKHRGGPLPRFRMVTGISTGALQSTFAFLGDTATIVEEYSIEKEGELLKPLVKGKFEKKPVTSARRLVGQGTLAQLAPLREQLGTLISPQVIAAVAREADQKRSLLVGAVEMGTGEMAVFDLTRAAQLYMQHKTSDPERAEQMRGCYIEALMASSSVPMSAAPVFIDNRLYIDGGARFGVLVDLTANAFKQSVAKALAEERASAAPKNLFLIVNATLEVPRYCGLEKCPVSDDGLAIPPRPEDPHPGWNFLQLAQRSVSVMINQAYRSSVFIAEDQFSTEEFKTRFVRLDPEHLRFPTRIDFPGAGAQEKICYQWQREDEAIDNPKEFFPRYMRCLIAYGRQHPAAKVFADAEPL